MSGHNFESLLSAVWLKENGIDTANRVVPEEPEKATIAKRRNTFDGESPDNGDTNGKPRKRQKIALACEACRKQKSRCDGAKPICGNCLKRNRSHDQCLYKLENARTASSKEYIDLLHDRIRELKHKLRTHSHVKAQTSGSATIDQRREPTQTASLNGSQNPRDHAAEIRAAEIRTLPQVEEGPGSAFPESSENQTSPVDGMGADCAADEVPAIGDKFYGSSSQVSFMEQIRNAVYQQTGSLLDRSIDPPTDASLRIPESASVSRLFEQAELFTLFPRKLTDYLLGRYWDKVHHLYPFIHRPTFMLAYEQLWNGDDRILDYPNPGVGLGGSKASDSSTPVFHCALNAILALAVQFSDIPAAERCKLSTYFFQRSKNFIRLEFFDDGSISVVQTLLIMTQYLQATAFPNRCWNTVGITCRLAQGLGLHLENPRKMRQFSPLELEMRRRTWHGCVMLDMVVSMTLGRPSMIYQEQSNVSLPMGVEDGTLDGPDVQPDNKPSKMTFYLESIKLYNILGNVLSKIYKPWHDQAAKQPEIGGTKSTRNVVYSGFDDIMNLDTAMADFEDRIPPHLQWRSGDRHGNDIRSNIYLQQSHVLRVRFLHLQILLHRSVLTRFCERPPHQYTSVDARYSPSTNFDTRLSSSFASSSALSCVRAAVELIDVVHNSYNTDATGAWWYNMFYIRTGAMVCMLAETCESLREAVGRKILDEAWIKCQLTLSSLLILSPIVKECLKALEGVHEQIQTHLSTTARSDLPTKEVEIDLRRMPQPQSQVDSVCFENVQFDSRHFNDVEGDRGGFGEFDATFEELFGDVSGYNFSSDNLGMFLL